ncbi:MAG TPA: single-stranded-DNA-specific exonuclease RecJ [Ktedonobacterales bacterium]
MESERVDESTQGDVHATPGSVARSVTSSGPSRPLAWGDLRAALVRQSTPPRIAEELPRAELQSIPGVTPLQAQLLANRGVRGKSVVLDFLAADWRALAEAALPGQAQAIERLRLALDRHERIVVYGDHDCDGMTSCALFLLALRALGADAGFFVPKREDDGRGLNDAAVRELAAQGTRLIVTTDCGSANVTEVALARSMGMDVIITDHHPIHSEAPTDCIIVNPRLAEQRTMSDDLAGAGVAFRLAEALLHAMAPERAESISASLLDLVAIGTIGDITPLTRESWALARAGLEAIRRAPRPGLRALLTLANVTVSALGERDITFVIAPRLNAAARLGVPELAVELLLATDDTQATATAGRLDELNQERQRVTEEIMVDAQRQVAEQLAATGSVQPLVSAVGEGWPLGMLGLVASRLTEQHGRPAVVISRDGDEARGSARGPDGVNLGEALAGRAEMFRRFGGHARAAGFTLASRDIETLLDYLRQHLTEQRQASAQGASDNAEPLAVDCRLPLNRLLPRIYREQQALAPYGPAFPEPVYICQGARITSVWRSGADGRNLRLRVRDATAERVFFWARQGDLSDDIRAHIGRMPTFDLIYTIDAFQRPAGEIDLLPRIVALRPLD